MNPPLSFGSKGEQNVTAPIVVGGADDEDVGATVLLDALEDGASCVVGAAGAETVVVGQPVAAAAGRSAAAPTAAANSTMTGRTARAPQRLTARRTPTPDAARSSAITAMPSEPPPVAGN